MPMYLYECTKCGEGVECVRPYEDREKSRRHAQCGGTLKYRISGMLQGKPKFQMAGIGANGERIPGTFGGGYRVDSLKRKKRLAAKKGKK